MPVVDAVLGAGDNRVYVADRAGRSLLLEVPVKSVSWGRTLCGISKAVIDVDPPRCTPALASVHAWAHSLVVFRNDERVWEGPIRRRRDSRDGLQITASDVLGWLEARPIDTARTATALTTAQMTWAIQQALAPDDPNVLAYLQDLAGLSATRQGDVAVVPGDKRYDSVLTDQTKFGGRWSALGRSIMLWDDTYIIGRLRDLSPENHMEDDVEVIEDGDLLSTDSWARNDQGIVARTQIAGHVPVDPFYGLVGSVVSSPAQDAAGVLRTAQAYADRSWPIPLTIEVPSNAALRCDAPFPISRLVPGVLIPVTTTTATARQVTGTFVLQAVNVSQKAGANEQVTVTLAPVQDGLAA